MWVPGPPSEYPTGEGVEGSRGDERRTSDAVDDDPISNVPGLRRADRRPGPGRRPAGDGLRRPRRPRLAGRALRALRGPRPPRSRRAPRLARPRLRARLPPRLPWRAGRALARPELRIPRGLPPPVPAVPPARGLLPHRLVLRPL